MSKKKLMAVKRASGKLATSTALADLLTDVRTLIEQGRDATARVVNSALVLLFWSIGVRIRRDILKKKRAEYGQEILPTLSAKLTPEYGQGFSERNLARMVRIAEVFPDFDILSTLSAKLGWSHFIEIIPHNDELKRTFYAEMCRAESWSVRTLRTKIGSLLFERTALSKKPVELARQDLATLRTDDPRLVAMFAIAAVGLVVLISNRGVIADAGQISNSNRVNSFPWKP